MQLAVMPQQTTLEAIHFLSGRLGGRGWWDFRGASILGSLFLQELLRSQTQTSKNKSFLTTLRENLILSNLFFECQFSSLV